MIRIAIVDDHPKIQNQLKKYITQYMEEKKVAINLSVFDDAYDLVEDYKKHFDIIFMDIQMKKMDGMTAAKQVRQIDSEVVIIFVTNMAGFAIEGYKVDALSYVVKPILYQDFVSQLNRAINKVTFTKKTYLMVAIQGDMMRLDTSKIAYIESLEHKVLIHMDDEELLINGSLKKFEKQLENKWFARCNSGFLVNLRYVESIEKNEVSLGQITLPLSRGKKKNFMQKLTEFIGGEFQ